MIPRALDELAAAESAFRRRAAAEAPEGSNHRRKNGGAAESPARIGRYELRNVIGQGAFGVVYRAWDTALASRGGSQTASGRSRSKGRARSIDSCARPAVRPGSSIRTSWPCTMSARWMECHSWSARWWRGETSPRSWRSTVPLPPGRRAGSPSLAEALEHAHGLGVIHRDVKPSNVLIDGDGRGFLTDFGLAKNDAGAATLTIDGQLLGTPAYMAPEQAQGQTKKVDARADVYAWVSSFTNC